MVAGNAKQIGADSAAIIPARCDALSSPSVGPSMDRTLVTKQQIQTRHNMLGDKTALMQLVGDAQQGLLTGETEMRQNRPKAEKGLTGLVGGTGQGQPMY